MTKLSPERRVAAGVPTEEALRAFHENVNQSNTIFSTDQWLLPKLERLRQLLPERITACHAAALLDVLYERRFMRDVIGWLESPGVDWGHYPTYRDFMQEKEQREREAAEDRLLEEWRKERETNLSPDVDAKREAAASEWAMQNYLPKARSCPNCGTPPESLEWYPTPPPPRHARGGYAGWHTRCKSCGTEVDFFVGMHWTRGRLHVCRGPSDAVH